MRTSTIPSKLSRLALGCLMCLSLAPFALAGEAEVAADFRKTVQPVLQQYCYDCHGEGSHKGGVSLDAFASDAALSHSPELWWKVLKNVRAGLMPPAKADQPTEKDKATLATWIKYEAFGLDPKNPDPGRVTIRRLNRVEYRNTIHDLMGVEYKTEEEFPADDTGYGFDNIGDVLTISPLLLEKYMEAAETIVHDAVPLVPKVVPEATLYGNEFRSPNGKATGDKLSFYKPASVVKTYALAHDGDYKLFVDFTVNGAFDFDPGRCKVTIAVDGEPKYDEEVPWANGKKVHLEYEMKKWAAGRHAFSVQLVPLVDPEKQKNKVELKLDKVIVQGPAEEKFWSPVPSYARFFSKPEAPTDPDGRKAYAAETLRTFATRAFRRPVDERTVTRLVAIAESIYSRPGHRFEEGIAKAMVAALASPRFLFRTETTLPLKPGEKYAQIDEHALASRLSYFLWSTMPDAELIGLADKGELRNHLPQQLKRMLADPRSEQFVDNFTGQWLEARDVEGTSINARVVMRADGMQLPYNRGDANASQKFDSDFRAIRQAMRRETQMFFGRIVHEDRSLLELLDSDWTYLNDKLAAHYGIEGVKGSDMHLVQLPSDSPRGGLLTQGTMLIVTSNPTRTSPVKRGQFILDNILGTPTPPPPPDIPPLEQSATGVKDHQPTVREIMELHRAKPLCASCHARMDPLGLGLEHFNAIGMWRDKEKGQAIDATGTLISGESFKDVKEMKRILRDQHRTDFYRCVTEKLLTYALGRGIEHYDTETVDQIVDGLQKSDGKFSTLLNGVIESAPFQRERPPQEKLPQAPSTQPIASPDVKGARADGSN